MTYPTGAPIYPTAGLAQVTSPRRGRQTALVVAIVAALVVVLGSVGGWLLFRDKGSDPPPPPPPQTFGAVDGDPINVGKEPIDIVGGGGFMWTANNGDATISKIDPASGTATQIEVGGDPMQLATTPGKVWVWNFTDAVTRVDVDTEEVSEPIATSPDIGGIAAADGVVWLSHSTDNTVTRLDGNTGALIGQPIKVGAKPGQLAAGDQSVLVINEGDKNISVVNSDGTVQTTLTVDDDAGGIEFVDDTFYLLSSSNLTPVDERTLTVGVPVSLQGAYSATAGNDGIFAAYPVTDELRWFDLTGNETKGTPLTGVAEEVSELIYIDGTLWLVDGPDGEAVRVKVR
jgi:DNA-binding beta-propeller fold protein YncE